MTSQDAQATIAIATLAALADGQQEPAERAHIAEVATALGLAGATQVMAQAESGALTLPMIAAQFSSPEARQTAYDTAAAICLANGWTNPSEAAFLRELAAALHANPDAAAQTVANVQRATTATAAPDTTADSALEEHILDQAIITAALEILPDRLANLGILPLQLRLVHHIGRQHGHQLDASQVKDLAATLGLGAAAQLLETMVRRTFGGLAGGLLGGALGGLIGGAAGSATGLASGAAVTFAATYALGHVATQYYAQGRQLSTADLKALFQRFRADAETIFPRVEHRIRSKAQGTSLDGVLRSVTR
ncbi:TerB family tellurite resistance protein [Gemmatimonas phototrophica]|uniref:TerB family tellurite resistance protein n=1 Tax=Gemmatimonas phototrophica TaxID=1379270 RepID=UPI00047A74C3|nr:TerB family tellurite resistance protein [Gemmatimonas phototrophica]